MRHWLYGTAISSLGLAIGIAFASSGALADVRVFADITKHKDKRITERIFIDKIVDLKLDVDLDADKFAESDLVFNQLNLRNEACENCAERRDTIDGSINGNQGVTSVNQASGNLNNQGNAVSAAIDAADDPPPDPTPGDPDGGFAESQASADQQNRNNRVETVNIVFRDAVITGAINGGSGITHVNQSVGNLNNQANGVSLAISLRDFGVALAETDLGQHNWCGRDTSCDVANVVEESDADGILNATGGVNKTATILGSINGNSGILGVNQAAGNFANQANLVSVAVAGIQ